EGLLDAIAQERRVELFAEWGHRFLDLKRTGKATAILGVIPAKQPWDQNQLLFPIPSSEIQANPGLTQNPGY
ncbi:MAG TPA: RagB/SusD family nutrient uptake outer membrane protein, partial [Pedobacter sp.]